MKDWQTPQLVHYGGFETVTQQDKKIGGDDGFTFMGIPIQDNNVS